MALIDKYVTRKATPEDAARYDELKRTSAAYAQMMKWALRNASCHPRYSKVRHFTAISKWEDEKFNACFIHKTLKNRKLELRVIVRLK